MEKKRYCKIIILIILLISVNSFTTTAITMEIKNKPIPSTWYPVTGWEQAKMENNVLIIWNCFINKGWTLEAIAGMLGNMQIESGFGPDQGEFDGGGGYGLTQWTPPTSLKNWCAANGLNYRDGNSQIRYIEQEMLGNEPQYYPTASYPETVTEFTNSTKSPEYLALAFMKNYERSVSGSELDRQNAARDWYTFLEGEKPVPPKPPKKGNFKLFYYIRPLRLRS